MDARGFGCRNRKTKNRVEFRSIAYWLLLDFSMSDTPTKPSRTTFSTVLGIVAAVIFYVLSYGPILALTNHGKFSTELTNTIYAPLFWLYENDRHVTRPFLYWYSGFWMD